MNYKSKEIVFNKNITNTLRGLAAIGIIIHHFYQYTHFTNNIYLSVLFQMLGFLCVCIFFFCSGYGLGKSAEKKDYLKNFLRNKILPLYLFEILLIIITFLYKLILNIDISANDLLLSFLFGKTIIIHGWYIQTVIILYFLFYLSFYKRNTKYSTKIILLTILLTLYSILCEIIKLPITWYEGVFCFLVGIIFSKFDITITKYMSKNWIKSFILSILMFIISLIISEKIFLPIKCISAILWIVIIIHMIIIFNSKNYLHETKISKLGLYSLELYVSQGFIFILYKLQIISNIYVFFIILILLTIILTYLLNKLLNKIKKWVVKKN